MSEDSSTFGVYTISIIAGMLGVHPQTLRMYERHGLIKPQRSKGNTRLYSEADLERFRQILNLTRDMGVNLAGVEIILEMRRRLSRMEQEFSDLIRFVQEELSREDRGVSEKFRNALVRAPAQGAIRLIKVEPSDGVEEEPGRPSRG